MYRKLVNPLSDNYNSLKDLVLSDQFPWYWQKQEEDGVTPGFYHHSILSRPEKELVSIVQSQHFDLVRDYVKEIIELNQLNTNYILRMSLNCTHNQNILTAPHVDHSFDHANMIVYLTDAGGDTVINNISFSPVEDDVICFNGVTHYQNLSQIKGKRVVLVITLDCL